LALFVRAPLGTFGAGLFNPELVAHFLINILPSMVLLGVGAGVAFNPLLLAAMSDVPQNESGLASGLVNTSFMMGGALGLAILASIAASRTTALVELWHIDQKLAYLSGYHYAFLAGGIAAALAAAACLLLRDFKPSEAPAH
jgi:MFS family permease